MFNVCYLLTIDTKLVLCGKMYGIDLQKLLLINELVFMQEIWIDQNWIIISIRAFDILIL